MPQDEHVEMAPPVHAGDASGMQELLMMRLGMRPYLLRLRDVSEIVRPSPLTPVPMAPDHLLGLANIHGQITCIIDPCRVLHLDDHCQSQGVRTRYVVMRHPLMHVGLWVDEVVSISQVPGALLPLPEDAGEDVATLGTVPVPGGDGELLNASALFR